MRYSFKGGNGHRCDRCGVVLEPAEQYNIKISETMDSTGANKIIGNRDLCENCLALLLSGYFNFYNVHEDEAIAKARVNSGILNTKKISEIF